ncbi:MAG: DUF1573 domain-containing protein [Planctomycetota bacterium]
MKHRFSELRPRAARTVSTLALASVLSAAAAAVTLQDGGATQKSDPAKAGEAASQDAKPVGRGRLSGRNTPPPPAAVPAGTRTTTAGAKPKPAADAPVGADAPQTVKAEMTPEQAKARKEYEAKREALARNKADGGTSVSKKYGAAPRPPRNPNAKLEIEFGSDKHDFGRARQGDLLTHTFELKSSGTEPVVISQASPTCGCTLGEIKVKQPGAQMAELYTFGDPIAPGSEVELAATLDTTNKRNQTNVRINVYSNDGKTGVTLLSLAANVEPFIIATPQFLQLKDIREGTEKTGTIDIRTASGEPIMLTEDDTRPIPVPEGLEVNLEAVNPGDDGRASMWRATFRVGADSPEGGKSYALRLNSDVEMPISATKEAKAKAKAAKVNVPTVYTVTANVNYRILGALSIQPQFVSLGLVRPGQSVVRNVRLTCHEEGFDLSGAKATIVGEGAQPLNWADRFSTTIKPVGGSNAVDVELRLDGLPDEADGSFRGRVVIETGHPSKPEMFYRFSGVCRKLAGQAQRPTPVRKVDPKRTGDG